MAVSQKLLYFRVILYKNDQRVQLRTFRSKTRLFNFIQVKFNSEWKLWADKGKLRVIYDSKNDYWNEFEFESLPELKDKVASCIEPKLLADFV